MEVFADPVALSLYVSPGLVDVPVWLRRVVSLLLPVVPALVLVDCAAAVAAPRRTAIADAVNARREDKKECFGFIRQYTQRAFTHHGRKT